MHITILKNWTGGKPWVLAANNLAVAYLKRDTVDTEVLKPLIVSQ